MQCENERGERVAHGAVAGMIGGAIASWVMNRYMASGQQKVDQPQRDERQGQGQSRPSKQRQQAQAGQEDNATVKTAQAISRGLFQHELTPHEKQIAGPAVHYTYGTLVGGIYGALAEVWPTASTGFGMLYGTALWLLGDEAAVPALQLGPPPTQVPPDKHADFFAAHLVYGIALDLGRRFARRML